MMSGSRRPDIRHISLLGPGAGPPERKRGPVRSPLSRCLVEWWNLDDSWHLSDPWPRSLQPRSPLRDLWRSDLLVLEGIGPPSDLDLPTSETLDETVRLLSLYLEGRPAESPSVALDHSGLQQSARPHIRVSVGDEKWPDSETGNVIDGHNTAVFVYFLCQNATTTHETGTQARIEHFLQITTYCWLLHFNRWLWSTNFYSSWPTRHRKDTRFWLAENKLSDFEVKTQTKSFLHCISAIPWFSKVKSSKNAQPWTFVIKSHQFHENIANQTPPPPLLWCAALIRVFKMATVSLLCRVGESG